MLANALASLHSCNSSSFELPEPPRVPVSRGDPGLSCAHPRAHQWTFSVYIPRHRFKYKLPASLPLAAESLLVLVGRVRNRSGIAREGGCIFLSNPNMAQSSSTNFFPACCAGSQLLVPAWHQL